MLWGVDLGGTKIEAVVIEPDRITDPILRRRVDTPASEGYEAIVDAICDLVKSSADALNLPLPAVIGMGTPGTTEPHNGLIKNSNTVCLNNRPLWDDVARSLGCDVRTANDANCFALAEATLGAGRGCEVIFGVILGTGVGGGVVVNQQVIGGRHGIGGEWGHIVMDENGIPCYCGHSGCLETLIAGPSLERVYFEKTGIKKKMREISSEDTLAARETVDHLVSWFGRAIGSVINILDPDAVILGGGIGQIPGLAERFRESALPWVFNKEIRTEFLLPELGDSAGVFGAAMLASPHRDSND